MEVPIFYKPMFSLSDIITKLHEETKSKIIEDYVSKLACFRESLVVGVCSHM
jgi:hypothetical protein